MSKKNSLILLFLIALAVRLFFFVWAYLKLPVSTEEAIVGLMSMHMLEGEFPLLYWCQSYMGTFESFFDLPLIWFFGPNTLVIRIYPFICSFLFLYFTYRLACKLVNDKVGIITLLLLVIPSSYMAMCSALIPPDNHMALILLGTLSFLLLGDICFNQIVQRVNLKVFLLGLLLGFSF